jgi:hypothetical protein
LERTVKHRGPRLAAAQATRPLNSVVRQHPNAVLTVAETQKQLKRLAPKIKALATASLSEGTEFSCLLRSSLSKSYELCVEAYRSNRRPTAFFLVPNLRSICEDVIVLAYVATISESDRNRLCFLLRNHELGTRLKSQAEFFGVARPEQPVLAAAVDLRPLRDEMRSIWQQNGWPNLKNEWMPPVRQMAEKYHVDLLSTLYEYMYRLTSGMVHFNSQALLRSGWGTPPEFHFSPRNFDIYYRNFARIYGLFLFCLYFELFQAELAADARTLAIVTWMKEALLMEPRWPEMVTFEEMNQPYPEDQAVLRMVMRFMDVTKRKERGQLRLIDLGTFEALRQKDDAA